MYNSKWNGTSLKMAATFAQLTMRCRSNYEAALGTFTQAPSRPTEAVANRTVLDLMEISKLL